MSMSFLPQGGCAVALELDLWRVPFKEVEDAMNLDLGAVSLLAPGRCWAATSTEGLLIFSLDAQMLFDPYELDTSITPGRVREALRQQEFTRAILMAFRLNERTLIQEALEAVPWAESEHPFPRR